MKLTWKFDSLGDWPALIETNIRVISISFEGLGTVCVNREDFLILGIASRAMLVGILCPML